MYGLPEEQESFAPRGVWQRFTQADDASYALQQRGEQQQRSSAAQILAPLVPSFLVFFSISHFSCNVNVFQQKEINILLIHKLVPLKCKKKVAMRWTKAQGKISQGVTIKISVLMIHLC